MSKLLSQIPSYIRSILMGLIIGIVVAISYMIGFISNDLVENMLDDGTLIADSYSSQSEYVILSEVQNLVSSVYLRELPDQTELEYAAIRGMLESLNDPATFFIDPPVAQSESQALAGTYGGIGVLVKRIESGEFALFPFQESPSFKAGLRDNDILLKVNGISLTTDLTIDEVDQLLRGEVTDGNGVTVEIQSLSGETKEFFIEFEVINIPSVISRLTQEDESIGYLQILKFTSRTPEELETQLADLENLDISALILDLRNNSGGLLVESIEVADQFLEEGTIVIEKSRDDMTEFAASAGDDPLQVPIVILVNGRTASASELLAGALRDNDAGILMGQKTFGKGTVQQIFPLSDGSSIHITSAEWFTPNELSIAENGLEPDITLIPDESGRDVEFGEAVRYLQSILN